MLVESLISRSDFTECPQAQAFTKYCMLTVRIEPIENTNHKHQRSK